MAVHEMKADWPEECRHILAQCFTDDRFESCRDPAALQRVVSRDAAPGSLPPSQAADPADRLHGSRAALAAQVPGASASAAGALRRLPRRLHRADPPRPAHGGGLVRELHRQDPPPPPAVGGPCGDRPRADGELGARRRGRHALPRRTRLGAVLRSALRRLHGRPDRLREAHLRALRSGADSPEGERRLEAWRDAHPQGEHGQHEYERADVGVAEDEISNALPATSSATSLGESRP